MKSRYFRIRRVGLSVINFTDGGKKKSWIRGCINYIFFLLCKYVKLRGGWGILTQRSLSILQITQQQIWTAVHNNCVKNRKRNKNPMKKPLAGRRWRERKILEKGKSLHGPTIIKILLYGIKNLTEKAMKRNRKSYET